MSIPQTMVDLQVNGGNLTISGTFGGPGGATFSGARLDRTGVDKFIALTSILDDTQIAELFQSSDHASLSFYSSVFACASLGEEAYPHCAGQEGQPPEWCALRRRNGSHCPESHLYWMLLDVLPHGVSQEVRDRKHDLNTVRNHCVLLDSHTIRNLDIAGTL